VSIESEQLLSLVKKYNVPGPRYTSYPTAVQFTDQFDKGVLDAYHTNRTQEKREKSLYIHIPFCFSLCWFCGCTKVITKNQGRGDVYLGYLEKEMELINKTIHSGSVIKQIHFGGGTPTFLSPKQLRRLGMIIYDQFQIHKDVEFSVEIDPRRVEEEHIIALKEIGCNRASLGVQDTNEAVQKAIHRIQPFEQTQKVCSLLRKHGIKNINIDLIYGLPRQTFELFKKTVEDVLELDPDRFAIYSYAHLPSIMPAQRLLNEADMPSTGEKLSMLVHAIQFLPDYGYQYIGMDHFAKEDDELSLALKNGSLQRNFQGYSTHAELEMIGLGMSGISQGDTLYTQNEKDLDAYYEMLDDGRLPIKKVLPLSSKDLLRRELIMQVMCKRELDYGQFFEGDKQRFKEHFSDELFRLKELESDGFIQLTETGFMITDLGKLFLRNIAMVFDEYLKQKLHQTAYSKTV